ncbi:Ribose-phosphate pyrophosphokinase 2 [bacterium HR39]|nr:Ribose-phosphate pyrophosphokinase 2 [bacterium HR39]
MSAPLLFALKRSEELGRAVAEAAGLGLAPHEEREFEDGEHKSRPLTVVRGRDCYVLHSLFGEPGITVNDKLCRLLFFCAALKENGAARVTAITPYICYGRKDRQTKPRDPVTSRYVAQMFEAAGVDRVVTVDVHNLAAYQNAFRIESVELTAKPLFGLHLLARFSGRPLCVVSPDAGGAKRAEALREWLQARTGADVPLAFLEKKRSEGRVSGEAVVGEVRDAVAVVIDDLVSSGTTLARAAQALRREGAAAVVACITHGLFHGEAERRIEEAALDAFYVTDTVPPRLRLPAEVVERHLTVVPIAPLLGEAVRRLHGGGSLTELREHGPHAPQEA